MTARPAFTEAQLRRAITAVEKKGYTVGGIKPDGTILVYRGAERPAELSIVPDVKRGTSWDDR
jgi:hypothetical protein